MVNVVLVDDEARIRQGLAKLIAQAGSAYNVTGAYASGPELLADIARVEADLILTDIKMPQMNGLVLIEKLRAVKPQAKLAVLSGFDDFAFARQALRLGVEDYLLKPVDTGELAQLLRKVEERLAAERSSVKARQEDQLRLLLFHEPEQVPGNQREAACGFLDQTPLFQEPYAVYAVHGMSAQLLEEVRAAAGSFPREWAAVFGETRQAALIVAMREDEHADTAREWGETLRRRLPVGFEGRIGGSEVFRGSVWLRDAYRQAAAAREQAWYAEGSTGYRHGSPAGADRLPEVGKVMLPAREFHETLAMRDDAKTAELVRRWLADAMRSCPPWEELRDGCRTVLAYIRSESSDTGVGQADAEDESVSDPASAPSASRFAAAYMSAVEAAVGSWREQRQENRVIETVKTYIQQHYAEELELSRLAEAVYLTPSYLSKLFRTETGETITDYLIRVRMEHAKSLLRDRPDLKTYEVGEWIGYADPAYFNKAFKRTVGCTPKEFRERVRLRLS